VKKWAPSFTPDGNTMAGWASGKLLETALAKESAKARAGNVTTEMILDGLWQLKNEKLNGLVPGLTFTKGAPAKAPRCYFTLLLNTKGVTAPLGSKINCLKD
jgi:branched-chain amino acid transport system substrate-binding protein